MTNQERLKELQNQKRELEKQLKNIEADISLYEDYTKKLRNYKNITIKEQLLDVYNQQNEKDIQIKLTKSPDYLQIYLNRYSQTKQNKFLYSYNITTYTIQSEDEFLKLNSLNFQIKNIG